VVHGTGRADGTDGAVLRYSVSPDYHDLLGVPIREGRALAETDRGGAPPVAVVSASLARSLFGEGTAIGRQIRVGAGETAFTIVGVADDVRQGSLASDVTAAVYTTAHQWHWADRVRWVAVDLADPGLVDEVKRAVWSVDSDQSIVRIERLGALVRRSEARRRFVMTVIGIFAGFALLLSGLGLYGVLSSRVAERTREMGIRAALGATRPEIVRLVVGHGMGLSTVGIVIGVVTAMLSSRALASLLFGVSGLDPVTYVAVATLFVMVAGLACWVPARRAARVDPLRSLAAE
jgi:putative ABC transport system permease protein